MPLPETEPNLAIRDLLADQWSASTVTLDWEFKTAWISTGWFDESNPNPQVTVTGVTEPTGPDGIAPSTGGFTSRVDGIADCNVWVPWDDSFDSEGVAKDRRWDLIRKVHDIIEQNQAGTGAIYRLETGEIRRDENLGREQPPYSALLEVGFHYKTAPG